MSSIIEYQPARDAELLPQCRDLHIACVLTDHQILRFLPPFTDEKKAKMDEYYLNYDSQVKDGSRHIFLAVNTEAEGHRTVTGMVMLGKPWSETGPFRGMVEMLVVSPDHRKQGIARKLMATLEAVAVKERRELLILDTSIGSAAEHVYPRWGYVELGRMPGYGISPQDGSLVNEVFYYKDLRSAKPLE